MVQQVNDVTAGRRSTPRPTYDGPVLLRRDLVAHHVWGDAQSSMVTDRVYLSNDELHVLEFELAPRNGFRHSAANKTLFAADVAYYVLEGELVLADPQYGEVRVVPAGTAVFFRRDTWHHGFNPSSQVVRVLEFFSPPPSRGAASEYARLQPDLEEVTYRPAPSALSQAGLRPEPRLHVVRAEDAVWSFADTEPGHLRGSLVETDHLSVTLGRVFAGHEEEMAPCEDESLLMVLAGELWVDVRSAITGEFTVGILRKGDAAYLPRGSRFRVLNRSSLEALYVMGGGRVPVDWRA
jgi:mannose-6-phosphate isomerase-like protein (cupin superfamily)